MTTQEILDPISAVKVLAPQAPPAGNGNGNGSNISLAGDSNDGVPIVALVPIDQVGSGSNVSAAGNSTSTNTTISAFLPTSTNRDIITWVLIPVLLLTSCVIFMMLYAITRSYQHTQQVKEEVKVLSRQASLASITVDGESKVKRSKSGDNKNKDKGKHSKNNSTTSNRSSGLSSKSSSSRSILTLAGLHSQGVSSSNILLKGGPFGRSTSNVLLKAQQQQQGRSTSNVMNSVGVRGPFQSPTPPLPSAPPLTRSPSLHDIRRQLPQPSTPAPWISISTHPFVTGEPLHREIVTYPVYVPEIEEWRREERGGDSVEFVYEEERKEADEEDPPALRIVTEE